MRFLLGITFLVLAITGCAHRPPAQVTTPFEPAAHVAYLSTGSGTLTGQGFLRQRGGGVVTCAGSEVYVFPATSFFREVVGLMRAGKQPQLATAVDPFYRPIIKQGQCDAQGNF